MSFRHRKADSGFTTMELMFVVLILGLLVMIAVASFVVATALAEKMACRANERILEEAVIAYQITNDGAFPADLADLSPDFIHGPSNYNYCPSDSSVEMLYDETTGDVSCSIHP